MEIGLLAGLVLAFGVSFGLGTRELTRNIVAGYYARKVLETGRPIEVAGGRGRPGVDRPGPAASER